VARLPDGRAKIVMKTYVDTISSRNASITFAFFTLLTAYNMVTNTAKNTLNTLIPS
jgi:hypothetical protein